MQRSGPDLAIDRGRVETRLWLQILNLEARVFNVLNSALVECGLSVAKFEVLAQLDRYPGGLSLGRLSSNLRVSGGNVSGLVRRLLADDLVTKEMASDDRRSFIVKLSPRGADAFRGACEVHSSTLARCFEGVPTEELVSHLGSLRALSVPRGETSPQGRPDLRREGLAGVETGVQARVSA